MSWVSVASWLGGLLTIIALVIAFLRQLIEFVTFLMFAIKIGMVLLFVALVVGIGFVALRTWQSRRRERADA